MLWHFYGLQGGGKSVGAVMFAKRKHDREGYKVYTNFSCTFADPISVKALMSYGYENAVLVLDEAYGIADSHSSNSANDHISEVMHQSRKRHVEVLWITQLKGDLYKRIRESAHRRVKCVNKGTDKNPICIYFTYNQEGRLIRQPMMYRLKQLLPYFSMYNSDEKIMPMHMSPELTQKKVLEIYGDSPNCKSFVAMLREENQFIVKDIAESVYALLKAGKNERAFELIKVKT